MMQAVGFHVINVSSTDSRNGSQSPGQELSSERSIILFREILCGGLDGGLLKTCCSDGVEPRVRSS